MHGRPPSSARPGTSAHGRPGTSFGQQQQQQQQQQEHPSPYEIEEEEYEEESEDEDVFAFLPPTTADQEQQEQQQQQSTSPYVVGGAGTLTAAQAAASLQTQYYPQDHSSPFSHDPYGSATTQQPAYAYPQYPDPTFDPWGRYPAASPSVVPTTPVSPAGASTGFSSNNPYFAVPMTPSTSGAAEGSGRAAIVATSPTRTNFSHPRNPYPSPPSPSTDSQPSTGYGYGYTSQGKAQDMYKLRRMNTGASEGMVDEEEEEDDEDTGSADRKREVRVSLPASDEDGQSRGSEKDVKDSGDVDLERAEVPGKKKKRRRSSKKHSAKSRNPNAQPYYAYAQHASAHGYPVQATATPSIEVHQRRASSRISQNSDSYIATTKRHDDGDSLSMQRRQSGSEEGSESEGSIKMEFDFDAIDDEDSPFPEVRASVSNIDDPDMPAMTIRMWFVGLLLCMLSSAVNVFFNFRSPAPSVVPLALLLVSYPFGKLLAFTLPITTYRVPLPSLPRSMFPLHQPTFAPFRLIVNLLLPLTYPRSCEFSLNPGPWNIKEHVLVYIMANVAVGNPYALNAIVVSETFYGLELGYWFSLTLVLATQLTGFGLAGMCRRFLVWPASMVWPQNLVACTLLNTLHAEDEDDGIGMYGGGQGQKGMSRYRFFVVTTVASFFFFFLPGYLFEALSVFSFICWAAPKNVPLNQLFGVRTGLGMSVITFDWTQITWIGSPLMVPWWAEVHVFVGFVMFYWILVPVLYYTNTWSLAHFPISANEPFDRFGKSYNISRVLQTNDRFNATAYYAYSPLYLPATYAMTYLLAFALSTCVIVHTLLYHGRTLLNGIKRIRIEADDIHAKLMRNYPEVPDWWYAIGFCVFFSLAVVAVEVWDTGVPVYALLLSILLPVIYVLPSGFIYAMTGQGISLNILAQIIPGTLLPGQPFANMVFKAYSVQTLSAATSFVQDLKLGHYVKVPPRATFLAQMIATTLAAFVQVGVKVWIFNNVEDICHPNQPSSLTCPHNQVFFTASAVWGLIGPTRQFGKGSIYHPHLYAIAVGAVLPLPFWFYQRRYPKSWVRYVSTPVVLTGVSFIPPATGINYSSWFAVGLIFQYLIRKKNFAWWSKFNYVLSSALDSGTVISVMVIFFTLQFPSGVKPLVWWGNRVQMGTADWNRTALLGIPQGGLVWDELTPP